MLIKYGSLIEGLFNILCIYFTNVYFLELVQYLFTIEIQILFISIYSSNLYTSHRQKNRIIPDTICIGSNIYIEIGIKFIR